MRPGPATSRSSHRARLRLEELEPRLVMDVTISGFVYHARDVADPSNLSPNPGPPLAGVTVVLDGGAQSTTTAADGSYSFTAAAGAHSVLVQPPAGLVGFSAQSLEYDLVLADGTQFPKLNFGLTPKTEALVQNLYELVLQRPADAPAFSTAVARLERGAPAGRIFQELLDGTEFQTVVRPVAHLIAGFFRGQPLDIGLVRHAVQLQNLGVSQDAAVLGVLYSQEFVERFGDTSLLFNRDYVAFLYQRLLRRAPTAAESDRWTERLDAGTLNRGHVALRIVGLPEFQAQRAVRWRAEISLAYLGVFGQEVTPGRLNRWLTELRQGATLRDIVNRLVRTQRFQTLPGYTDTLLWDVQAHQLGQPVSPLSRLQRFNKQTGRFDTAVAAGSIGSSAGSPSNVYFIAHGWAPGYEEEVLLGSTPGNPLKAWQTADTDAPYPAWLYAGVDRVSAEGLAQAIVDADANAVVIAFSWIDQSATPLPGSFGLDNLVPLLYAGQSEAYTQVNGLRLSEAIQAALSSTFFADLGLIHLLGHSHGAKVAGVAALDLQLAGVPVTQLTPFESPEAGPAPNISGFQLPPLHLAGLGGAQNFLWYYLQQMQLSKTPVTGRTPNAGTFVDNYFSEVGFGSALGGYPGLGSLVDVKLHAEVLYPLPTSFNDPDLDTKILDTVFGSHDYPPPWYAQASLTGSPPEHGLGWSPLLDDAAAAGLDGLYEQTWTEPNFTEQFELTATGVAPPTYTPTFTPLQYARQYEVGAVTDSGVSLTLGVDAANDIAAAGVTFNPLAASTGIPGTGIDFQVTFSGVDPGEQVELVVWIRGLAAENAPIASINDGTLGYLSIPLFAMAGADAGSTPTSATISLDGFLSGVQSAPILGPFSAAQTPILGFTLKGAADASASVTVSNLRQLHDGVAG
jgi:hypothetical protein